MSEGIYPVEEIKADWSKKPSPWHTETPTEEGWYLVAIDCGTFKRYETDYFNEKKQFRLFGNEVIAWCKFEPYKA